MFEFLSYESLKKNWYRPLKGKYPKDLDYLPDHPSYATVLGEFLCRYPFGIVLAVHIGIPLSFWRNPVDATVSFFTFDLLAMASALVLFVIAFWNAQRSSPFYDRLDHILKGALARVLMGSILLLIYFLCLAWPWSPAWQGQVIDDSVVMLMRSVVAGVCFGLFVAFVMPVLDLPFALAEYARRKLIGEKK